MSYSSLARFLKKHKQIGLDTNVLIYFIEGYPAYEQHTKKIFTEITAGRNIGICSTLNLLEVLVQPYRKKDEELVNQFYGLLTSFPNLAWVELSTEIADLGAQLRANYKLKTPDAILLATAIHSKSTGFVGNDIQMKQVKEIEVFILS